MEDLVMEISLRKHKTASGPLSYKIRLAHLRLVQGPLAVRLIWIEIHYECLTDIYSNFTPPHDDDELVAKFARLNDDLLISVNALL